MNENRPHKGNDSQALEFAPAVTHAHSCDITVVLERMRQLYGAEAKAQIADTVHWQAEIISLGPLTLVRGSIDTPTSISGSVARLIVLMSRANTIAVHTPGGDFHAIAGQSAVVVSPGSPLTLHNPADMRSLHLSIDPTFLTRQFEALTGRPQDEAIDFQSSLDLTAGVGAFLYHTCHYLAKEGQRQSRGMPSSLAASLSEGISRALLSSHQHSQSYLLEKPTPPSSRTVVRIVEEYIDAHATEPLVASDLAQATGASVMSIEAAFLQHRGMTPTAFLKARRLESTRKALLEDPHLTIPRAALLAGYVGFAPFEAAYFKRYGETPAETRRRGFLKNGTEGRAIPFESPEHRLMLLSNQEREVCNRVARGLLNKQIAGEMGITQKTVQAHRGRAMHKLGIQSAAELARLWERLGK